MAAKGARPHRQSAKANKERTTIELLRRDSDGVARALKLPIGRTDRDAIRLVLPPVARGTSSDELELHLKTPLLELRDLNDGTVLLRLRQRLPIATIDVITSKLAAV